MTKTPFLAYASHMQHGTCRCEKAKAIRGGASVESRLKHNLREKEVENAIPSLKTENSVVVGKDTSEGILSDLEARLATVTETIRPDSIKAIEILVTVTSDSLAVNGGCMTPEKVENYLEDGRKFVENLYGKENVISGIRHQDEGVPHYHFIVTPIQKVEKAVRRVTAVDPETGKKTFELTGEIRSKVVLNSQNIYANRTSMVKFQNDFFKEVSEKYGLERGVRHSVKRNIRSEMMVDIDKRYAVLIEREGKNSEFSVKLEAEKKAFDLEKKEIYAKNKALDKQLKALEERLEKVEKWEKKTAEREKEVEQREAKNDKKDEFLTVREAQHEKFSEAEKTKLRGFELPETGFLESAKDYKARIEPVVKGKISRALQTIDQQDQRVMIAVDETKEKLRTAEIAVYSLRQEVQTTRSALEEYKGVYKNLKDHVMGITSMDEVKGIQTKLAPKKSIDRGMER